MAAIGQDAPASTEEVGSKVCALCHAEIYRTYSATGMSRSSGQTGAGVFRENFGQAIFPDPASGAEYRVLALPEGYRLEFLRNASDVHGQRLLQWFVGSGAVGRSYLFSLDGFLFQAPVSYYSTAGKWDVSPGYQRYRYIHLARPVEATCLRCHASRLQPVAGTQNGFRSPPFLEGGVSCERCHGPGKKHIARMGGKIHSGPREIVNPAKLDPVRRDSVCAQCHLTGVVRVARVRAKREAYRPGELLSDYSAFFVWSGSGSSVLRVTSHFEKLEQSSCKKASGDRLWCGTCHDPHAEPAEAKRAAFYRARCEKCHEPPACGGDQQMRRKVQDNCAACHMPKSPVRDIEHGVYTDHSIPRRQPQPGGPLDTERSLAPFWKTPIEERDLGLAYAVVAGTVSGSRQRAVELLRKAEARDPGDLAVAVQLAQLYDQMGDEERALVLYERVVRADPAQTAAAINLGILWIQRDRAGEAIRLWQAALSRNPGLTNASINLAVAQYRSGDRPGAEATLVKALKYDPDEETARRLLTEIRGGPEN